MAQWWKFSSHTPSHINVTILVLAKCIVRILILFLLFLSSFPWDFQEQSVSQRKAFLVTPIAYITFNWHNKSEKVHISMENIILLYFYKYI